jgi:cyanophycinase
LLLACANVASETGDGSDLTTYLIGNPGDAVRTPTGPGLVLAGGGTDVDAAMAWFVQQSAGGDIVVLRTSGGDAYNSYLYTQFGPVDSVETMIIRSQTAANHPYVRARLATAEGIFIAGGDQATYVADWRGTAVEEELHRAWMRGAVLGGTSAGCAVLANVIFSARLGSIDSPEALANPYSPYVTLDPPLLGAPAVAGVVTDSHFAARDRMGRLVTFVARMKQDALFPVALGIGVDERTALLVDAVGDGRVVGEGAVYVVEGIAPPSQCLPSRPLEYDNLRYFTLRPGDSMNLPGRISTVTPRLLSASNGRLFPENPY